MPKYDSDFFEAISRGSRESARIVVPLLMELFQPKTVVDVGCGNGQWLRVFQENKVERIHGFDGADVDPAHFAIRPDEYTRIDLSKPFALEASFDLALCLEVAEHLPAKMAKPLVHALTHASPVIVFSAAIPGQGGTYHINEQWPHYWEDLFAKQGYCKLDIIRPRIFGNRAVEYWYRQNIFVYVAQQCLARSEFLQAERELRNQPDLELIHSSIHARFTSFGGLLSLLPGAFWRAVRNRI